MQAGGGRLRADLSGCKSVHAAKRVVNFREKRATFRQGKIFVSKQCWEGRMVQSVASLDHNCSEVVNGVEISHRFCVLGETRKVEAWPIRLSYRERGFAAGDCLALPL